MNGSKVCPPRRGHTKSRNGCETCKRRHIRCDELFPQCNNCTRYRIRCPYNDAHVHDGEHSTTLSEPNLMWMPHVAVAVVEWQARGVFPFPSLSICVGLVPHMYPVKDLRLIVHVASLFHHLACMDTNKFTLWTRHIPIVLQIGAAVPYVMHALLAFSATHVAFLTGSALSGSMAFEHRAIALRGLRQSLNSFSRETSDGILAASLVLSWQTTDRCSRTQLAQGIMSVIEAMDAWKHESELGDFITETSTFPTTTLAPTLDHQSSHDREDIEAYHRTLEQVHRAESYLHRNREETVHIQHLISSLKGAGEISPEMDIIAQYERLQPLMGLAFWMPVGYLQSCHGSPGSLIVIAHLYTVTILMARLFPKSGAGYCGSLSVRPLEEIARQLQTYLVSSHKDHRTDGGSQQRMPLTLMEFPIAMLGQLRSHR